MPASALCGILACPRCHAPLGLPKPPDDIICVCGERYAWDAGVPDLTPLPPPPGLVADRWALWEQLQENGAAAYAAEPVTSLSVGDRVDARLFGAFADLRGRVLDVGCGPQRRPSYVPELPGVELVGIDPLRGVAARDFSFVRGLGEYLPFASGSFDRVLFGTSLDHLLDPDRALREAFRVLAPDGRAVLWFGLPGARPPLSARMAASVSNALSALRASRRARLNHEPVTPDGAVDAFHFEYPSLEQVEASVAKAGLEVVERAQLALPTMSMFLAAVPRTAQG
jgi:SAM-dependent methyltransferase